MYVQPLLFFNFLPKVAIGGLASDSWLQLCLSKARNVVVAFNVLGVIVRLANILFVAV